MSAYGNLIMIQALYGQYKEPFGKIILNRAKQLDRMLEADQFSLSAEDQKVHASRVNRLYQEIETMQKVYEALDFIDATFINTNEVHTFMSENNTLKKTAILTHQCLLSTDEQMKYFINLSIELTQKLAAAHGSRN